jgi:hypothetical protein
MNTQAYDDDALACAEIASERYTTSTRNDVFRRVLRALGVRTGHIERGRQVCEDLDLGMTRTEVVADLRFQTGMNAGEAIQFVAAAIASYAPWRITAMQEVAAA